MREQRKSGPKKLAQVREQVDNGSLVIRKIRRPNAPLPAPPRAAAPQSEIVSSREREGLIARIRQIRRVAEPYSAAQRPSAVRSTEDELRHLGERLGHLEHLVQGLQDSVHRETTRQDERIAELEAQIRPGELARALSEDARNRGL